MLSTAAPSPRRWSLRASSTGDYSRSKDFEQYAVQELEPVRCEYRGFEVISSPPTKLVVAPRFVSSSTCSKVILFDTLVLTRAQTIHYMVEAMRHAYVDRNTLLGDPDFVHNPLEKLLSEFYAADIRERIDPFRNTPSREVTPGTPPHEWYQYHPDLDCRPRRKRGYP